MEKDIDKQCCVIEWCKVCCQRKVGSGFSSTLEGGIDIKLITFIVKIIIMFRLCHNITKEVAYWLAGVTV